MKILLMKIIALILIFETLYSCSKGGGGSGNDSVVSLNSFYSLDDLSSVATKSGKVPLYTTSGSENGLISMGDISSCVVMSSGKVKCWGFNAVFQLGSNKAGFINQKTPVLADILLENAVSISAGYLQTCAYLSSGMKCWGDQNDGVLGNQVNSATPAQTPQVVKNLGGQQIKMMAIGDSHVCVLFSGTQSVSCWGQNSQMQLAQSSTSTPSSLTAVPINLPEPIKSIATSDFNPCAVAVSGNLYCWGQFISTPANPNPVLIASNVKNISSGEQSHFCYTDTNANIYCFGTNDKLQLGSSTAPAGFNKTPLQVSGISHATAIVAGKVHTCAITNDGASVVCWGDNSVGQLGASSNNPNKSAIPIAVVGLPAANVIDIAAADNNTCALLDNDDVYCWGNNTIPPAGGTSDFLGVASPTVSYTAVKVLNRNDL
ncbi:RCC1 domain-containing protein [Fluviispira sanaruensis]|uniref:Uncharacterized protein n=1 Tax=Fluviispira sanaruensis TaxID=2493639 RepID=A0A4P2VN84_FLUSA|nr:hypothetical protein [Fluviispira sanaruensis]BBH53009.1 hypothetical protein JCM31447_14520 [Fluviispira sanaruensis]